MRIRRRVAGGSRRTIKMPEARSIRSSSTRSASLDLCPCRSSAPTTPAGCAPPAGRSTIRSARSRRSPALGRHVQLGGEVAGLVEHGGQAALAAARRHQPQDQTLDTLDLPAVDQLLVAGPGPQRRLRRRHARQGQTQGKRQSSAAQRTHRGDYNVAAPSRIRPAPRRLPSHQPRREMPEPSQTECLRPRSPQAYSKYARTADREGAGDAGRDGIGVQGLARNAGQPAGLREPRKEARRNERSRFTPAARAAPCRPRPSRPTPEEFLGHPVGADRKLAPYPKVLEYLRSSPTPPTGCRSRSRRSTLGNEMVRSSSPRRQPARPRAPARDLRATGQPGSARRRRQPSASSPRAR